MKKLLSLILTAVLALSLAGCRATMLDPESLVTRSVRTDMADGGYTITDYNEDGQVIRNVWYNAGGTAYEWYTTEYDEAGNAASSTWHYSDGSCRITEYDENGCRTGETLYNADGSYSVTVYDETGTATGTTLYNADGTVNEVAE